MMFHQINLPPAPQPPADEYPADAVAPRFDELGRRFMPEEPYPGILNIPLGPIDALALSSFWSDAAADAARMGNGEVWSFAEERAAAFLRLARIMQPNCRAPFISLSAEQLDALIVKPAGGVA
jgi:hypothetical protein